jgi:lysophospholipase L1-like esterase
LASVQLEDFSGMAWAFTLAKVIPIMTIGDSWLYRFREFPFVTTPPSLANELAKLNYGMGNKFSETGQLLSQMATPNNLKVIKQQIADLSGTPNEPRAILISGGGNDIVNPPNKPELTRLFRLLNEGATTVAGALIAAEVTEFIDNKLSGHYRSLFQTVTKATDAPIFVHAYDHPIPDGRFFDLIGTTLDAGPWLTKVFDEKKIVADLAVRTGIMKILIEDLNVAVEKVAGEFPGKVHYVKFAGELAKQPGFSANYKDYWDNELHPTELGFEILAKIMQAKLASLGVK